MSDAILTAAKIKSQLATHLPDWRMGEGCIERKYTTTGWPMTLMLINAIGYVAEAGFHHPDLAVSWAQVVVKLSTHSAKGVTAKDIELAQQIEQTVLWLPAKRAALEGFEKASKGAWVK